MTRNVDFVRQNFCFIEDLKEAVDNKTKDENPRHHS